MRSIVVGLWVLAVAVPAAGADLDGWHRIADLVIRGEVVQVSGDGDAVTVVLDRPLRGEKPPLALTFAPAGPGEGWGVGDRALLFLRHRADPDDGPRWSSLAPRGESPDASDPLAAAALDRYFGDTPAGPGRAEREARAVQALGGASPALARHGARSLEALAAEGPLSAGTRDAVASAGVDRNPVRRLGAVVPLRRLACAGDRSATALLGRLASDGDVEVASLARRALATGCDRALAAELEAEPPAAGGVPFIGGLLVACGLLGGGLAAVVLRRRRGARSGVSR